MVIYYGTRWFGRVDQHDGEYAQTQFFHVYLLPLVPMKTMWITGHNGSNAVGHAIKFSWKSAAAAYLRLWGLVGAVAAGVAASGGSIGAAIAAAVLAGLSVWSWTWRSVRGDRAKRRSDLNLAAYGTRCDATVMSDELRGIAKRSLDAKWASLSPSQTPDEVARMGTTSPAQLVVAYGLLRLAAAERGRHGHAENAAADRILDGEHDITEVAGGPYREGVAAVQNIHVGDAIQTVMTQRSSDAEAAVVAPTRTPDEQARYQAALQEAKKREAKRSIRGKRAWAGLATLALLGGLAMVQHQMRTPTTITVHDLANGNGVSSGQRVTLTCDQIDPAWQEMRGGRVDVAIALCNEGDMFIAVKHDPDVLQGAAEDGEHHDIPGLAKTVTGELRDVPMSTVWVDQGLHAEASLRGHYVEQYIDATDHDRILMIIFGGVLIAVGLLAWPAYFWWKRKNRSLFASAAV